MFTRRISYPLMLAGALAPARQFHYRLCDAARTAKTATDLRHGLLAWLNSLNEMNCPWYEYPLRDEVAHQLQIQGISPRIFNPVSGGRVPPPRIIDTAIDLLIDCALDGVHDVLATARQDEAFKLKLML